MRLSNYNIDFITGHVPYYQQQNVTVKTNQFYRDAFVNQMKEGKGFPIEVKRQMGLNSIFDDERNYQSSNSNQRKQNKDSKLDTRHCSGTSNDKLANEPRITLSVHQKRRGKMSSSQATFRSLKKDINHQEEKQDSAQHIHKRNIKSDQIQNNKNPQQIEGMEVVDEAEQIKNYLRQEQQKIYFVKSLEQKQNIRYAPLRKFHELSNRQSQIQSAVQSEKVSVLAGSGSIMQEEPFEQNQQQLRQQIKSELNFEDHQKVISEKFHNQNINKILSGQLNQRSNQEDDNNKNNLNNNGKFHRISRTSQQSKRQTKQSFEQLPSEKKFLDAETELRESHSNPITKRNYYFEGKEGQEILVNQNSQDASGNSLIQKLIKDKLNNQQESYMKEIKDTSITNTNMFQSVQNNFENLNHMSQQNQLQEEQQQQLRYNQFNSNVGSQQQINDVAQLVQELPFYNTSNSQKRKSDNIVLFGNQTTKSQMFRHSYKGNEPILTAPIISTKHQINQNFQNSQTIQNQLREKANLDHRKELLSFFNENRYKYFSNNDLNAEKYFVTRNRERIKNLNFERIGIFKSKQPNTHVKHFRFFINDIQVQEPRFQNPLKTEQEQLSLEQSFRKASHASHASKLSNSDLIKEGNTSYLKDTNTIAANLIGATEVSSQFRGGLSSPVGAGSSTFFVQSLTNVNNGPSVTQIQSPLEKQLSPMVGKTPLYSFNTPSAATATGMSPHQTSAQSKFQFMSAQSEQGADSNFDNQNDHNQGKDSSNMKKLKQQYLSFVQQNMNTKQVKLNNNNPIKEEKDESFHEEERGSFKYINTDKNQQQIIKKSAISPAMMIPSYVNTNQNIPSSTSIKPKKQLKVNIVDSLSNQQSSSQQNVISGEKQFENISEINIPLSSRNEIISPIKDTQDFSNRNINSKFSINLQQNENKQSGNPLEKKKISLNTLQGKDSIEFDNNYMVCMQLDKDTDGEYIYSKQFQEQIKLLEQEQKRLEEIENLFFLRLKQKEINYYMSEDFKIHRKKMLLDTILKNKKITRRDKKLIFQNLLYQYNFKSRLHSKEWCKQMTHFLMTNKFKYNLDEAANRKYERAHKKIIQLPTFRDPNGEYYYDFYNFVHDLASPSPLTTEENEIHFQEYNKIAENSNADAIQENKAPHIARFKPKQLSQSYTHFQFLKFKY